MRDKIEFDMNYNYKLEDTIAFMALDGCLAASNNGLLNKNELSESLKTLILFIKKYNLQDNKTLQRAVEIVIEREDLITWLENDKHQN